MWTGGITFSVRCRDHETSGVVTRKPWESIRLRFGMCPGRGNVDRAQVTHIACSHLTDFLVSASQDGHVKFWKKQYEGIEFVKHYRAHVQAGLKDRTKLLVTPSIL